MKDFLRKTVFYRMFKKYRSKLANMINGYPSSWMFVIWITWTDGKTTTANILHKLINDNLWKAALISTVNIKIWDEDIFNKAKMTSLDPMQLHKILSYAKEKWCKYAVLEVSSHGIDQYRFEWVSFDMWILTNITAEHLDYHKTIENYANTKKQLFYWIIKNLKKVKYAIFPKDSEFWRQWYEELAFDKSMDYWIMISSGLKAENVKESLHSTSFNVKYLWKEYPLEIKLLWKFNVYNTLAAMWAWILLWISLESVFKSVSSFQWLPWRMQSLIHEWVTYFVDFAHTPNWLESVLKFLYNVKGEGKIITVFWAPGERDKFKRPQMWKAADQYSDIVILTDDDPTGENRYDIIAWVYKWIKRKEWDTFYVLPEREMALSMAINLAKPWDVVFLAGKGHEQVQLTNFGKRKWNDMDTLKALLKIE